MFKAMKECMRNWVMTHKRLYWYIVVGIAALAFGIITGMGCAKLERAEAAEDMQANFDALYESQAYVYAQQYLEANLGNNEYYCIFVRDQFTGSYDSLISDLEFDIVVVIGNTASLQVSESLNGKGEVVNVYLPSCAREYVNQTAEPLVASTKFNFQTSSFASQEHVFYLDGNMDITSVLSKYSKITVHEKPIQVMYSLDAPFTNFQRATMKYGYEADNIRDFYNDWMANNEWKYYGHLNNIQPGADLNYSVDATFVIQLPTVDYLLNAFSAEGLDLAVDSELGVADMYRFYKCIPDVVHAWYNDKNAPYLEYEFEYPLELVPDENGNFVYGFTLLEIETLIKYFNPDVLETFKGYSEHFRAIYMTFAHVRCITSMVETEREDCIVYGKVTTNQFGRGIYDTCVEVIPEVDIETMTPEEMDKIILDATEEAHDKYLKDLEDRIDELESQMGGMTSVDGAFANLEGSDLWTGFQSLVSGLASLGPSISALSTLTGAVFGFLPLTITGIMSTTLFAICIIAIIKAIRG